MMTRLALLCAAMAGLRAASSAPCYGKLDGDTTFETPCYTVEADDGRGLEVRTFAGDATLVTFPAASSLNYGQALTETADLVICYFTGECNENATNALDARTVPLTLRTPNNPNNFYEGAMALAPSKWPHTSAFPVATYGDVLKNLNGTIASLSGHFPQAPAEADFDALCAELKKGVSALGYRVLQRSHFTPTHARYYSQSKSNDLPWDAECWVGVAKV